MARLRIRSFAGSLVITGPPESSPPGTLRRGRGLRATTQPSARSRWGSTLIQAAPAAMVNLGALAPNAATKLNGHRFQVWPATTGPFLQYLVRDGVVFVGSTQSAPPRFAAGIPNALVAIGDHIFIANSTFSFPAPFNQQLTKIGPTGATTRWGIPTPNDFVAGELQLAAQENLLIDAMLNDPVAVTPSPTPPFPKWALDPSTDNDEVPAGAALNGSSPIGLNPDGTAVAGGGALRVTAAADTEVIITRALTNNFDGAHDLDLTTFADGTPSPTQDFISLYVHVNHPARVESITIAFSVNDPPGQMLFQDQYTYEVTIEPPVSRKQVRKERGLGDLIPIRNQDQTFLTTIAGKPQTLSSEESLGVTQVVATTRTWTRLRIPKAVFHRAASESPNPNAVGGSSGSVPPAWDKVRGVRFSIRTNEAGTAKVAFCQLQMIGQTGMQGDYVYAKTYYNAITGTRSNPNPGALATTISASSKVLGVVRQPVLVTVAARDHNAATLVDPQITHVEYWRTLGNGVILFGLRTSDLGNAIPVAPQAGALTSFEDATQDYVGFADSSGSATPLATVPTLNSTALPVDNAAPPATMTDVAGPHYGRLFWLDSANPQNIYFTPSGRLEGNAGFVTIDDTSDTLQRLIRWSDTLWAIGTFGFYEVIGTDEPFLLRKVAGVPGVPVAGANTVVATPYGIAYRSTDGIRLFSGQGSELIGWEAIGPLYRGENAENLTAFNGIVAEYARDEYIISDGAQTLAWNLRTARWRDLGIGVTCLNYEDDVDALTAGVGTVNHILVPPALLSLEVPNVVTDNGLPIPFELRPPSTTVPSAERSLVQRLVLEGTLNGQQVTPILILDGVETTLPVWTTGLVQTTIEYPIVVPARVVGVRLVGQLIQPIEVVEIAWDVYTPPGQEDSQP